MGWDGMGGERFSEVHVAMKNECRSESEFIAQLHCADHDNLPRCLQLDYNLFSLKIGDSESRWALSDREDRDAIGLNPDLSRFSVKSFTCVGLIGKASSSLGEETLAF